MEDTRPLSRVSSSLSTDRAPSRSSVESDSMHGLFATSSKRRNLTTRTNDTLLEQADEDEEEELEAGRLRLFASSECAPTDEETSVAGDDREDDELVAAGSVTARTSQINATVRDDRFGLIPHFDDLTIHEESASSSSAQEPRKKRQKKSAAAAAVAPSFHGDTSLNTSTSGPRRGRGRGRPVKGPPSGSKQQRRNEEEPSDEELNESASGDSSSASGSRDRGSKSARRSAQKQPRQPAARQRSSSRKSSPSAHNTSLNSSAYNLRERLNTSRASADTSASSDLNRSTRSAASNAGGNRRGGGAQQQQPASSSNRRADPSDRRIMDTSRHQKHR